MELENAIDCLTVSAFEIPTDSREADGTLEWDSTTLVIAAISAAGKTGMGYSYASTAAAVVIDHTLRDVVVGRDPMDIAGAWRAMRRQVRNIGEPGIASAAISAVDIALWDLKAKLLDVALVSLLGACREGIDVYGSGGFTSYDEAQLVAQLAGWVGEGIPRVKMKVGANPQDDPRRVQTARQAIGGQTQLFVDANGAYTVKQAERLAHEFAALGVVWFEEPRPSSDVRGLDFLRRSAPFGMEIAAGEYGYCAASYLEMIGGPAVDVVQADATRCQGVSGFMAVASLVAAYSLPLSAHCAPALHAPLCCAAQSARHIEYFHDHARIEEMLFDGVRRPENGKIRPDLSRPGLGLEIKWADAERYRVYGTNETRNER